MSTETQLPIHEMDMRHPGLTEATAASNTEALRVCLDRHHQSPVAFDLNTVGTRTTAIASWEPTDPQIKAAWANEIDATEAGACACVLAAVELADGLVAIGRAETGTGADYYVANADAPGDDFESAQRLEVSGLNLGDAMAIKGRLEQKREQAAAGDSPLPALAGVVGFRERLILLSQVDASSDEALRS